MSVAGFQPAFLPRSQQRKRPYHASLDSLLITLKAATSQLVDTAILQAIDVSCLKCAGKLGTYALPQPASLYGLHTSTGRSVGVRGHGFEPLTFRCLVYSKVSAIDCTPHGRELPVFHLSPRASLRFNRLYSLAYPVSSPNCQFEPWRYHDVQAFKRPVEESNLTSPHRDQLMQ